MKNRRKGKTWIRRYWGTLWLLAVEILLLIGGSLAAYTSFSSVKRVVSTGESQAVLFSSNYLYLIDKNVKEYSARRVTPVPVYDTNDPPTIKSEKFTVSVSNYLLSNPSAWNTQDINYTLTATLIPINGGDLPDEVSSIQIKYGDHSTSFSPNGTLTIEGLELDNTVANTNSFVVYLPKEMKEKVKIEMKAEPIGDSYKATNDQKLAAVLIMGDLTSVKNWTGHFLDVNESISPDNYAGFNYEISGNGKGTVTLTWDYSKLELSSWFVSEHDSDKKVETNETQHQKNITFSVGEEGENGVVTAYQTQFYWAAGAKGAISNWDELENYVTVEFAAE